ncbi:cell wall metabolism sensor histidine kinase WalK [Microbacterium sp. CIAB417]|uniref:sensor histidine kinase n=1 Tax=Microbacterium sp. CIAB417 TaxID=2860287 RepID=UPI001FAE6E07|nr:HAMP domain-containing sensor histidine kinase [Microbacterium sp. CIAB417]
MTEPVADSPPRRSRGVSVRTRIVAAITAVTALGLLAVGLAVSLEERQSNLDEIDARLRANLDSARFIVADGDRSVGDGVDAVPWKTSTDALRAVVQRMSPDDNAGAMGMVDGRIGMVPGVALDIDLGAATDFAAYVDGEVTDGLPVMGTYAEDGVVWRYLAAPISVADSPAPEEVLFVLAYDVEAELAEFDGAARTFLVSSIIVVLIVAATGTVVATRLLRPLRQMRETANRVSAQSLDERIPLVGNDDVAELARTMNAMLDRLDAALESQRELLSDVGHELKTPITIVRGHVEVMDPTDPADARQTQSLVVDELDRMGRLVQDLASAASLHGPSPVNAAPVDVADLVQQIFRKAQGIVGAEPSLVATAHVVAELDAARITQAMLQLAQNAVTHGSERIEIGSRADAETVTFWVRDFGPGVPDKDKQRVFERFHRGTDASAPGSGLGLNIVQVIAHAHGGSVTVADAAGSGAVFALRIPRFPVRTERADETPAPQTGPHPSEET